MCTIAMHWIEAEKMTRWRSGENNEREEKEEKKSKRGGAGEKKRQMVERTGKRKIQNKREKVEEVCTYCYIWDKRSEDCRNKIFLGLSLNSLLIFAHRQGCSLNHGFVERAANGPSIHGTLFDDRTQNENSISFPTSQLGQWNFLQDLPD